MQVAGHAKVHAIADEDLDRENDEKTSSVHSLRFELTSAMKQSLAAGAGLNIGVEHPEYAAGCSSRARRDPSITPSEISPSDVPEIETRPRPAAGHHHRQAPPACKKLDIKPQDETVLTRGLRKKDADVVFRPRHECNTILPENEYVNLPVTSTPTDWLKFKVQRFSEHEYALDPASIAVGGDGIARYSLLIRSAKGVDNVSHEGVRCVTGEWKMYATAVPTATGPGCPCRHGAASNRRG